MKDGIYFSMEGVLLFGQLAAVTTVIMLRRLDLSDLLSLLFLALMHFLPYYFSTLFNSRVTFNPATLRPFT